MQNTAQHRNGQVRAERPTTVHLVERIVSQRAMVCGCDIGRYEFFAMVAHHNGQRLSAKMEARELLSFRAFKKSLLERFGVLFIDDGKYSGRGGQAAWDSTMSDLLNGDLPA